MWHIQFDGDGAIVRDDDVGNNAGLAGVAIARHQYLGKVSRDWEERAREPGYAVLVNVEPSRSKNRALQIIRSLTGLLSLQIRAAIAVPLNGDRNDAADFDRGSIVREFDISLDVYGVAGGSDANYLPLGCDAPKLEEKECCQREQHVLRYYENFDVVDIYCSPH